MHIKKRKSTINISDSDDSDFEVRQSKQKKEHLKSDLEIISKLQDLEARMESIDEKVNQTK